MDWEREGDWERADAGEGAGIGGEEEGIGGENVLRGQQSGEETREDCVEEGDPLEGDSTVSESFDVAAYVSFFCVLNGTDHRTNRTENSYIPIVTRHIRAGGSKRQHAGVLAAQQAQSATSAGSQAAPSPISGPHRQEQQQKERQENEEEDSPEPKRQRRLPLALLTNNSGGPPVASVARVHTAGAGGVLAKPRPQIYIKQDFDDGKRDIARVSGIGAKGAIGVGGIGGMPES